MRLFHALIAATVITAAIVASTSPTPPPPQGTDRLPVASELDTCELRLAVPLRRLPADDAPDTVWNVDPAEVRCDFFDISEEFPAERWAYIEGSKTLPGLRAFEYSERVRGWVRADVVKPVTSRGPLPAQKKQITCNDRYDAWYLPRYCMTQ